MSIIIPRETLYELIDKESENISDNNFEYGLWTAVEATESEVAVEFKKLKHKVSTPNLEDLE